jgi:hypothetical protein
MTNGGKRPGAGRPPAADPASKLVTVRMTTTQHAKFIELGGSRWVKLLLGEAIAQGQGGSTFLK